MHTEQNDPLLCMHIIKLFRLKLLLVVGDLIILLAFENAR